MWDRFQKHNFISCSHPLPAPLSRPSVQQWPGSAAPLAVVATGVPVALVVSTAEMDGSPPTLPSQFSSVHFSSVPQRSRSGLSMWLVVEWWASSGLAHDGTETWVEVVVAGRAQRDSVL